MVPTPGGPPPCTLPPLTLHIDGDALPEAVHVVVDYAGQRLLVGFPAGHQAVAADDSHCAIGVPDLLILGLALQPCFPGHYTRWLPIGRSTRGHQDLIIVPLLGSKHCLSALYPVGGFGCGERAMESALVLGQRCTGPEGYAPARLCFRSPCPSLPLSCALPKPLPALFTGMSSCLTSALPALLFVSPFVIGRASWSLVMIKANGSSSPFLYHSV